MHWQKKPDYLDDIKDIISDYTKPEHDLMEVLLAESSYLQTHKEAIHSLALNLTQKTREVEKGKSGMASLVQHYDLSTQEGVLLMCVAEALLRIPDKQTEKLLISDKLSGANWQKHLGQSESSFVNLSTWGLSTTSKILSTKQASNRFMSIWNKMLKKTSEGVIRQAVRRAIKMMSEEFVLGRTIEEAVKKGKTFQSQGYTFSFDMLGEEAVTYEDAKAYFQAYLAAIEYLGQLQHNQQTVFQRPGISVKLSALYPRYEFLQQEFAIPALVSSLKQLALKARDFGIALTVDAEEADRLDMSLQIFKQVYLDGDFSDWEGLGLAVQSYQRRGLSVVRWLIKLAKSHGKRIPIRLVKGAYWDTEIKHAQMEGWDNFPVFTRKASTDISYLACAKALLESQQYVYPGFATHNAFSVAAILTLIEKENLPSDIEFQNLQGMGKSLHAQILERGIACRVYAPVGSHENLLPYLVRRLLENGANTSFVNQLSDDSISVTDIIESPVDVLARFDSIRNSLIPLPQDIFHARLNSCGVNLSNLAQFQALQRQAHEYINTAHQAAAFNDLGVHAHTVVEVINPGDLSDRVGEVAYATVDQVKQAVDAAREAFEDWNRQEVSARADVLEQMALLLEQHQAELITLLAREAGKVITDAVNEIREAVDFCRYYAQQARVLLQPTELSGYTGESDSLVLSGRGVMVCISPWNFPVAIFVGQVAAALVTGNAVLAKPAEQTSLLAAKVVSLFYQAGLPARVLQLLPGLGETIGAALVKAPGIGGVIFTGSTVTAKWIARELASKEGPIVPLIAETGGINAMMADSSALTEQLVQDVVLSAFGSAGQRCSALRVLFIQEDVADRVINMLQGAMQTLRVGNVQDCVCDIGPVIDAQALDMLKQHEQYMALHGKLICKVAVPSYLTGHYFAPQAWEIDNISVLQQEVFGPMLHVIRYASDELDTVIDQINALGFGLTFGIHSRIKTTVKHVQSRIKVGNMYVNRNIIGAVVGLQPFGGCGLSGTGPKAGGPHYLPRLCHETCVCEDTTAAGGNASLMMLDE